MKTRNKIFQTMLLGLVIQAVVAMSLMAQSEGEHGTTMNLSWGSGARAMGLGRAYTALANDPSALFWNPAGLENVQQITFTLFHNQIFEGTTYDFFGLVYPTLNYGSVGFGYARLGTGDIPIRTRYNELQGNANYEESELYISYAKTLPFHILGGVTFKIRRQQFTLINQTATGMGLDIGFIYRPTVDHVLLRNTTLGFNYRNFVSPSLKLGTVTESEPYNLNFGYARYFPIGEGGGGINFVLDYRKNRYVSGSIHTGAEYLFRNIGTIRLGFDNGHLAFGGGVKYSFLEIDYSFGSVADNGAFPATHRFSVTFHIGKTREELILIAEEKRKQRERELVEKTKEEERKQFIAEHLQKGQEFLQNHQYFDAYVEFQQVISVDPFNKTANALLDSADQMIKLELEKRQQEAIAKAVDKELARENKKFVDFHMEKGRLFLEKNQFTDALMEFNLALERAPDDPTIQDAIATTKRRLEEQVRKLVKSGREEFQKGNYSNALRILSEALVLAPDNPQLKEEINTLANRIKLQQYVQKGLQLYDLGEYEQALSLFEEALRMDPTNQQLKQYIERTKRGLGTVEVEMDQEAERQYYKGVDLFLAGRYQEALEIWKELQKKYPYSKKLQDNIRSAEERLRRTKE